MKHTSKKSDDVILRQKAEGLLQNKLTKTTSQLSETEIQNASQVGRNKVIEIRNAYGWSVQV